MVRRGGEGGGGGRSGGRDVSLIDWGAWSCLSHSSGTGGNSSLLHSSVLSPAWLPTHCLIVAGIEWPAFITSPLTFVRIVRSASRSTLTSMHD